MPSTALPLPVLAVTHDAVRHLQGREAVSSLWILFTKCKESLHDGRRLENIAWRLWYRALAQDEEDTADEKTDYLGLFDKDAADKAFDEKVERAYDEKQPLRILPKESKKPDDELVEKRERDRDYGRTGSWQEREKDRLANGNDVKRGGKNGNDDEQSALGVQYSDGSTGTGLMVYRPLTPDGNFLPLRATSVPAPGSADVPVRYSMPLTNGLAPVLPSLQPMQSQSKIPEPVANEISTTQPSSGGLAQPAVDGPAEKERRLSTTSVKRPISIRRLSSSGSSVSVGKVICEMLPSSSMKCRVATPRPASAAGVAEPRSAPTSSDARQMHCDLPLLPNGKGNVSGLPTPGTEEEHGNASFPGVPAPQCLTTTTARSDVNPNNGDSGDRYRVESSDPVHGGGSVPVNGEQLVFVNGRGSGMANGVAALVPIVADVDPVPGSGADFVPPNARSRNPAADNSNRAYDSVADRALPPQESQVSYPPHNIQLIHPTPVHVTTTSPPSDPLSPPRLVVVNPTPNPTPHPTPPATPVLLASVTSGNNVAFQLKGYKSSSVQYLELPGTISTANGGENEPHLPSPLLRVPGPEGRRIVAMRVEPILEEIPEMKEEQCQQQPSQQQKSTSLSSASSGYSAVSNTTNATSMIEDTERDKKKSEQMAPLSSVLVVDGRIPVPVLPPPTLLTPAPTILPQFQAQLAESPVSQASVSPTKPGMSQSPASVSAGSPSQTGKVARAGLIRRASSGGGSTSSRSRSTGTGSSSRALSRSRSREGTGGLMMTTTRPSVAKVAVARPSRGRIIMSKGSAIRGRGGSTISLRRSTSEAGDDEKTTERRQAVVEGGRQRELEREKQARDVKRLAKFNIGSNSDDGSGVGSKSAGSGSDASAIGRGARFSPRAGGLDALMKGKGKSEGEVPMQKEKERLAALQERESQMKSQQEQERSQQERMREQQVHQAQQIHEAEQQQRQQQQQQQADLQRQQKELQRQAALRDKTARDKDMQRQLDALVAVRIGGGKVVGLKETGPSNKLNAGMKDLAQPLLPQHNKKKIVITSESEFSEEDEDWSSEEMSGDDVRATVAHQPQQQPTTGQQQQQYPSRPPGPQRTQSTGGANGYNNQAQVRLVEVNREREMFAKRPSSSFTNLQNAQRTRSGLLSQLMNPDPRIFPPEHPYRRGFSSGEIVSGYQRQEEEQRRQQQQLEQRRHRQFDQLAHQQQLEQRLREQQFEQERQQQVIEQERQQQLNEQRRKQQQQARAMPLPPSMAPRLGKSKSAAALPVMSGVLVGSVASSRPISPRMNGAVAAGVLNGVGSGNSGYRPRPRPQGLEFEEDSGSEDEGGMGMSKSTAEEKLKALAERRGKKSSVTSASRAQEESRRRQSREVEGDDIPVWAREVPPSAQQRPAQDRRTSTDFFDPHQLPAQPQQPLHVPTVIPLGHPYNLPPPDAPMTPRTTRRKMLQAELPESLRRQILWHRQVSRTDIPKLKRTASGGGGGGGSRGNLLNGLRPLTTTPSMVQLTAKGSGAPKNDRERRKSSGLDQMDGDEREQAKRTTMTRNRSWAAANDFHLTGW